MIFKKLASSVRYRTRRAVYAGMWPVLYTFTGSLYPRCQIVKTYWWNMKPNFGDLPTPWILKHFGVASVWAPIEKSDLVGIGSVIQRLPTSWSGMIWGSGMIREETRELPAATIVGVRGRLTQAMLETADGAVLGDPGLLVGLIVERQEAQWDLGIVPHYEHRDDKTLKRIADSNASVRIISVERHPAIVVREIAKCRAILATSLHGLIVADALGIPAFWTSREPLLSGGEFKFVDYESVVSPDHRRKRVISGDESMEQLVGCARTADPDRVAQAQSDIVTAIGKIQGSSLGITAPPWVALLPRHSEFPRLKVS